MAKSFMLYSYLLLSVIGTHITNETKKNNKEEMQPTFKIK